MVELTLLHTDVLVNVNSTIALEAMLVDTPVVMVAFDGSGGQLPYLQSDARFLDYEHMRALVETGGVRVVRTACELVSAVAQYLQHPATNRAERYEAARTLYGPVDGRAAERVAQHLLAAAARNRGIPLPSSAVGPPAANYS
jgi:CDP-glycerol glycerophosphotransferase (TagB/SpsB family)